MSFMTWIKSMLVWQKAQIEGKKYVEFQRKNGTWAIFTASR